MSVLPELRFPADRPFPFRATGLDVFGPFSSRTANEYHNRYALIFTCSTTRAVHLEMCLDVSTSATVNALRRFLLAVEPLLFSYQTTQRIFLPLTMIYNSSSRVHRFITTSGFPDKQGNQTEVYPTTRTSFWWNMGAPHTVLQRRSSFGHWISDAI